MTHPLSAPAHPPPNPSPPYTFWPVLHSRHKISLVVCAWTWFQPSASQSLEFDRWLCACLTSTVHLLVIRVRPFLVHGLNFDQFFSVYFMSVNAFCVGLTSAISIPCILCQSMLVVRFAVIRIRSLLVRLSAACLAVIRLQSLLVRRMRVECGWNAWSKHHT